MKLNSQVSKDSNAFFIQVETIPRHISWHEWWWQYASHHLPHAHTYRSVPALLIESPLGTQKINTSSLVYRADHIVIIVSENDGRESTSHWRLTTSLIFRPHECKIQIDRWIQLWVRKSVDSSPVYSQVFQRGRVNFS